MFFYIRVCVVFSFAVCLLSTPQQLSAQELTEKEALQRFEAESPQARALLAKVTVMRAETKGWSLLPNPSIGYTREDARGAKDDFLVVQQQLPVTGRLGLLRRAGEAAVKASEAKSRYELVQLRGALRAAFYDLLLSQRREAALRQGIQKLEEVVRILLVREREGEGSAFDRLRAGRELADTRAQLSDAEVLRAQAQSRLASFFTPGTEPSALTVKGETKSVDPLPPLPQLVERALAVRGDYRAGELQIQRLDFERKAANRQRLPEPILSAGLKTVREFGLAERGYVVAVTLPIPLFNRGQAEAARASAEQGKTQAELATLQLQIETEIKAAYAAARIRRRIAESYARELGDKGSELEQVAQLAFREGEQGILELLDAHRVALDSQLRVLELVSSAKQAVIELDRTVGEEVLP